MFGKKDKMLRFHIGAAIKDKSWWGDYGHVTGFCKVDGEWMVKVHLPECRDGKDHIRRPEYLEIA